MTKKVQFKFGEAVLGKDGIWTVSIQYEGAKASQSLTPEASELITELIDSDYHRSLVAKGTLSIIAENLRMMVCMQECIFYHYANGDDETAVICQEVLDAGIAEAFDWIEESESNYDEEDEKERFQDLMTRAGIDDEGLTAA